MRAIITANLVLIDLMLENCYSVIASFRSLKYAYWEAMSRQILLEFGCFVSAEIKVYRITVN
jgi:hypothetical protein